MNFRMSTVKTFDDGSGYAMARLTFTKEEVKAISEGKLCEEDITQQVKQQVLP